MDRRSTLVFIALCAFASTAFADLHLTPQQCNAYPFKPVAHVTRRGLQRELAELEAVGYRPQQTDVDYPADIERAEHALRVVYRRDCGGVAPVLPAQNAIQTP
ncbi:DUF4148 domain-containing protein [Pararobbsia silviterrae]|uniref:DUF4148 domain-containing protein n=1 Tax=Pararobbsia silviterrae TaxID=1792498 RepID=A0A494Y3R2_9BURK|nr:DUF4148 domain-containing protein [Pararobbsia silviterrae]RKP54556.1 DUF4148 domain-containing protein [Pararobbsia silviterrae]